MGEQMAALSPSAPPNPNLDKLMMPLFSEIDTGGWIGYDRPGRIFVIAVRHWPFEKARGWRTSKRIGNSI
jgi:hypothetical protein